MILSLKKIVGNIRYKSDKHNLRIIYFKDGKTLNKFFQLTRDRYAITACLTLS